MKQLLFFIVLFFNLQTVSAQIFDVESIMVSGDDDKRINLVILSEGYQNGELNQFITDATSFTNDLFNQSPFSAYVDYFNVYAIKVASNESGSDHPGTASDVVEPASPITNVDTYFNTSYDSFGTHRLLYSSDYATIGTVLANNFPNYDQALILVNSAVYGGSGGTFPFTSTGASANEIAIHELGHSLFDLKDEYYPGDLYVAEAINMTQETDPNLVKWKNWVGTNSIGIYPYGSSGVAATWNRPHQNCKMRYLGVPFCSVCKEGIIEKIHDLISPIDSYTPVSNTLNNPSYPIDFNLNLIESIPNTLSRTWTLNAINIANDVDNVSVLETDLNTGLNTLVAAVTDDTSLLKVDNHQTLHISTVTWSINKSALGIDDITSEDNKLSIIMFPNPGNAIVNLKLESASDLNLRVELISLDGKKLKTVSISNYETKQLDISNLSTGIYISNFYSDNTLIASKKLVKN